MLFILVDSYKLITDYTFDWAFCDAIFDNTHYERHWLTHYDSLT